MTKVFTLILFFFFLLSEKSFSQTATKAKACYIKAIMLDSASGKPTVPDYNLNKPLPTLILKDTYACKCVVKTYEIIVVRGKRPIGNWTVESNAVNLSSFRERVQADGNVLIPGDRFMLSVKTSFSGSERCFPMPGGTDIFVGVFKAD